MAGVCDLHQRLCLSLALWNGRDPILKERMFGLTGSEGNHGEDVKDYWWYLDALPSHALLRWRYHYPQQAFPYADLVAENRRRGKGDPEYELLDTGVFDRGYWVVEATYAKAAPDDVVMRVTVKNAGPVDRPDPRAAHPVVPQHLAWEPGAPRPELRLDGDAVVADARDPRRVPAGGRRGPRRGGAASPCSARTRRTPPASSARARRAGHAVPQGRHQRPRGDRRADGEPVPARHQGGLVVRRRRGPGRDGGVPLPAARRRRAGPPRPGVVGGRPRRHGGRAHGRGGRLLRRRHPGRHARPRRRWCCARASPGCSGRSSTTPTTSPAGWTAIRASRPRRPRAGGGATPPGDHLDAADVLLHARPLGVPLVRRLGPGLPRRHLRLRRPHLRQVPADRHVPGVVHAPQRGPAGLRVGLRRRQPAGARLGRR